MSTVANKLIKAETDSAGGFSVALVSAREGTGITDRKYHLIDVSDVSNLTVLDTVEANDGSVAYLPSRAAPIYDGDNVGIAERAYDAISYWDVSDATSMTLVERERNASAKFPGFNNFYGLVSDEDNDIFLGNGSTDPDWQAIFKVHPTNTLITRTYRSPNTSTFNHGSKQPALDAANRVLFVTNASSNSISAYTYSTFGNTFTLLSTLADNTDLVNVINLVFDETTDTLYAGLINGDITSVDVSNPSSMSVIDKLANVSGSQRYYDMTIDKTNQVLFGCSIKNYSSTTFGGSIYAVDISDNTNLAHLDYMERPTTSDLYFPYQMDVDVAREYLFIACSGTDKMVVVDYSDPSSLTVQAVSSTSNFKQDTMLKLLR